MKSYTTTQVARAAKISRATLQAWIAAERISSPPVQLRGNVAVRLWTAADIKRLLKFRDENYCKGRGRKRRVRR
jgi:hypothetical protein